MKVKMKLVGLTFSQVQAGAYAVILAEEEGTRRVPIIIGTPEAQAIALFLDDLQPPRPLTHDLFVSLMQTLNITLTEVFIHRFDDGVFYSNLIFSDGKKQFALDSRTSDAIAIALRTDTPISMSEDVLVETGTITDDDEFLESLDEISEEDDSPENMDAKSLKQALQDAVETEDYEQASYLRDLIKRRES
jgi:bifunctional DNase/RNase